MKALKKNNDVPLVLTRTLVSVDTRTEKPSGEQFLRGPSPLQAFRKLAFCCPPQQVFADGTIKACDSPLVLGTKPPRSGDTKSLALWLRAPVAVYTSTSVFVVGGAQDGLPNIICATGVRLTHWRG